MRISSERFRKVVSFDLLGDLISQRNSGISRTAEVYLNFAEDFFYGLASRLDAGKYLGEDLEAIGAINPDAMFSSDTLRAYSIYFARAGNWVSRMEANPDKFYKSGDSLRLKRLSETLSEFYMGIDN